MYPNQQQNQNFGVGFYIPPAIQGDFGYQNNNGPTGFQQSGGNNNNISDMLKCTYACSTITNYYIMQFYTILN